MNLKQIITIGCILFTFARSASAADESMPGELHLPVDQVFSDTEVNTGDSFSSYRFQSFAQVPDIKIVEGLRIKISSLNQDFNALDRLNQEAELAWKSLLACAGNNALKARNIYRDKKDCSTASNPLLALRKDTQLYLSSMPLMTDFPKFVTQCEAGDAVCESKKNYLANMIPNFLVNPSDDVKTILSRNGSNNFSLLFSIDLPSLHPFLQQVLLEHSADGYPFPHVYKICGFLCIPFSFSSYSIDNYPSDFSSIDTAYSFWSDGHREESQQKRNLYENVLKEFMVTGTINSTQLQYFKEEYLQKLRVSISALQVLQLTIFSKDSGSHFGLWPEASKHLLVAMLNDQMRWAAEITRHQVVPTVLYTALLARNEKMPALISSWYYYDRNYNTGHSNPLEIPTFYLLSEAYAWKSLLQE